MLLARARAAAVAATATGRAPADAAGRPALRHSLCTRALSLATPARAPGALGLRLAVPPLRASAGGERHEHERHASPEELDAEASARFGKAYEACDLHEKRVVAGAVGGRHTAKTHSSEFYSGISEAGHEARGASASATRTIAAVATACRYSPAAAAAAVAAAADHRPPLQPRHVAAQATT
jgi:hypothetical protein